MPSGWGTLDLYRSRPGALTREQLAAALTVAESATECPFFSSGVVGDPSTLHLHGAIDALTVDALRRELAHASRGGTAVLGVDLTDVAHPTNVGVAAPAEALHTGDAGGHPVALLAPTGTPAASSST